MVSTSIKITQKWRTGAFFGINQTTRAVHILHPLPFYGKETYSLEKEDIPKIKELYEIIKNTRSKRYDLIIEKFLFALSGLDIKDEHRFLELASILEMLYTPKGTRTELGFRISLRVCKVFSKYLSMDAKTTYNDVKRIYNIRSGISHSGSHRNTSEYLEKLVDYVRKSITLFLRDNSLFEHENLNKLCIDE